MADLLIRTDAGFECGAGGFTIDPRRPVARAIVTHAHDGHFAPGCGEYVTSLAGEPILRARLGDAAPIRGLAWGEPASIGKVRVWLHPSGHVRGSAQVRIEPGAGRVWCFAGDVKEQEDPTCEPLDIGPPCDVLLIESTYALPVFRWPAAEDVIAGIEGWWRENREAGRTSILHLDPVGKAQRVLAGIDDAIGPILLHDEVAAITEVYRAAGVRMAPAAVAGAVPLKDARGALALAPPAAGSAAWSRRFPSPSRAAVSGMMRIRGTRRRLAVDRGFILSDHADWAGLNRVIDLFGARRVIATHGQAPALARWLRERGLRAEALP